jgi:hypothetical protein
MAAKIKEAMGTVYALLIIFKESEKKMREAAVREEYAEAAHLKIERDAIKEAALEALAEVEKKFIGGPANIAIVSRSASVASAAGQIDDEVNLSLSTIKDESFLSRKSANSTHQFSDDQSERTSNSVVSKSKRDNRRADEENFDERSQPTGYDNDQDVDNHSDDGDDDNDDEGSSISQFHPLAGVDNAEGLPAPEEISKDISSDLIQKVEELFGSYRTKCFFSKASCRSCFMFSIHAFPCRFNTLTNLRPTTELAIERGCISQNQSPIA